MHPDRTHLQCMGNMSERYTATRHVQQPCPPIHTAGSLSLYLTAGRPRIAAHKRQRPHLTRLGNYGATGQSPPRCLPRGPRCRHQYRRVARRDRRRHAADPHVAAAAELRRPPGPARRRVVRELAVRRGDQHAARLEDDPGRLRGVRRELHDGRALPERLPRRRRRGHRLRRGPPALRRRQGGVGVRRRRDHAVQPPLLRQPRLRAGAVQLVDVRRVREGGERAGAAGDAAAVQEAAGAGHQAGDPHGAARGQAGGHGQEPRARRLHRLREAPAQASGSEGAFGGVQVRRAEEAGGRRLHHRRQHRGPVDGPDRRAGGRSHVQAARPHVLHRLALYLPALSASALSMTEQRIEQANSSKGLNKIS